MLQTTRRSPWKAEDNPPRWKRIFGWVLIVFAILVALSLILVTDEGGVGHKPLAVLIATPALSCAILSAILCLTLAYRVVVIPFWWAILPAGLAYGLCVLLKIYPFISACIGDGVFIIALAVGAKIRKPNQ